MSSMLTAPAAMPPIRQETFAAAPEPQGPPGRTPREQVRQPGAVGEGHQRGQAGVRQQVRVIEHGTRFIKTVRQSHLQGVLSNWLLEASNTPIIPGQGAPFH